MGAGTGKSQRLVGTGLQNDSGASGATREGKIPGEVSTCPLGGHSCLKKLLAAQSSGTHGRPASLRSSSPLWWPWSSTMQSTRCLWWTDTAVAGSSPACCSPPSPKSTVDHTHTHLPGPQCSPRPPPPKMPSGLFPISNIWSLQDTDKRH
ncbi:Hypothetical predicted protein [Marmota monax]|uniref:Uncharacterized protein n=1 Tax=Marmota monax TaxID=9995 RepID=A0A5E4BLS0_MARMO|nr:hypothetical protein GHT09_014568 [Marmota monax]VTJ70010.1 Hypothetical predicted protein [Marmota monax]